MGCFVIVTKYPMVISRALDIVYVLIAMADKGAQDVMVPDVAEYATDRVVS